MTGEFVCRRPIAPRPLPAGLDKIEFLQSNQNHEIYQKAFDIIETYFGSEEEVAQVAPADSQGEYQFSAPADPPANIQF